MMDCGGCSSWHAVGKLLSIYISLIYILQQEQDPSPLFLALSSLATAGEAEHTT